MVTRTLHKRKGRSVRKSRRRRTARRVSRRTSRKTNRRVSRRTNRKVSKKILKGGAEQETEQLQASVEGSSEYLLCPNIELKVTPLEDQFKVIYNTLKIENNGRQFGDLIKIEKEIQSSLEDINNGDFEKALNLLGLKDLDSLEGKEEYIKEKLKLYHAFLNASMFSTLLK